MPACFSFDLPKAPVCAPFLFFACSNYSPADRAEQSLQTFLIFRNVSVLFYIVAPLTIIQDHLILIREYAVGTESYELGFSKGLIDPGESVYEAANRELKEEVGFGANDLTFLKKLSMAPSYFSSKMNIVVAQDLYPESLEGDEPEPLPQVRWPLAHMMDLLEDPDFNEARNVSALFLVREWLKGQGRV